ncbi:hypothetical protein H8959_016171 [Pygathrix nigripes]
MERAEPGPRLQRPAGPGPALPRERSARPGPRRALRADGMRLRERSLRQDPDLRQELASLARGCDFVLPSRFKKRLKAFQQVSPAVPHTGRGLPGPARTPLAAAGHVQDQMRAQGTRSGRTPPETGCGSLGGCAKLVRKPGLWKEPPAAFPGVWAVSARLAGIDPGCVRTVSAWEGSLQTEFFNLNNTLHCWS